VLKSVAETPIVSCDELTKAACFTTPCQLTVALERKFDPLMERVKPLEPAGAFVGEIDWMTGIGFGAGRGLDPPPHEHKQDSPKEKLTSTNRLRRMKRIKSEQSLL